MMNRQRSRYTRYSGCVGIRLSGEVRRADMAGRLAPECEARPLSRTAGPRAACRSRPSASREASTTSVRSFVRFESDAPQASGGRDGGGLVSLLPLEHTVD